MDFRTIQIPTYRLINNWLISIYEIKTHNKELSYYAIPNGKMGIMISLSGTTILGEESVIIPTSSVAGMLIKPVKVKHSFQSWEICLVFNPIYLKAFLKERISFFSKAAVVNLEDVIKSDSINNLKEGLFKSKNDIEKINLIEDFLKPYLINAELNPNIVKLFQLINDTDISNVNHIAKDLSVSPTTIRNWSSDYFGLSPKELIQIKRFKKILEVSDLKKMMDTAYNLNYYDQAHLCNFFKQKSNLRLSNYFNNEKLQFDFKNYERWLIDSFLID